MNEIICCDVLDGLKTIEDESADIVLVDPPYNIGKDFGVYKDNISWSEYRNWAIKWLDESVRILKESGSLFLWGDFTVLSKIVHDVPYPLNEQYRDIPWIYTNRNTDNSNFWKNSHEIVLHFWKDKNKRIFNLNELRGMYTSSFLKNSVGKKRSGTPGRLGASKNTFYKDHGGSQPRDFIKKELAICEITETGYEKIASIPNIVDVDLLTESLGIPDFIDIPCLSGSVGSRERWFLCETCNNVCHNKFKKDHIGHNIVKHNTQKAYRVTERLFKAARKENGVVVVPFAGTGSECAVAEDLGMNYIGFDLNQKYVELATETLKKRKKGGMICD